MSINLHLNKTTALLTRIFGGVPGAILYSQSKYANHIRSVRDAAKLEAMQEAEKAKIMKEVEDA